MFAMVIRSDTVTAPELVQSPAHRGWVGVDDAVGVRVTLPIGVDVAVVDGLGGGVAVATIVDVPGGFGVGVGVAVLVNIAVAVLVEEGVTLAVGVDVTM